MSRPRKPTKILEASGAFKRNPKRKRGSEPEVTTPIGNAPEHMEADQVTAWCEIVVSAPAEVLTGADRLALEIAAVLMAEFREDPREFQAAKLTRLTALLGQFGMTPSERSKLGVGNKPKENAFADF